MLIINVLVKSRTGMAIALSTADAVSMAKREGENWQDNRGRQCHRRNFGYSPLRLDVAAGIQLPACTVCGSGALARESSLHLTFAIKTFSESCARTCR